MRDWLIVAATGYVLLLISFIAVRAALDPDHVRGQRAVRVLRLLLLATSALAGAALQLHHAGLL
ncbi:hypothetical protein PV458_09485 [Streptomyces sp. MN03-5084-2B]|nr:hypothetical protein [Streptomyces sp. MN03-5084-2B]